MTKDSGAGPSQVEPTLHYLAEDDECEQASGGLNHLVSRNAEGDR